MLTVHGIGFQQPPKGTRDGYADGLHRRLRTELGARLGEDPEPPGDPARPGGGPVYVQSEWKGSRHDGLGRLSKPLIGTGDVAHVALVYSPSLPPDPQPGATLEAAARAALSFGHYTSVMGALRMLGRDVWAIVHHPHRDREASSNLLPRTDISRAARLGHHADVADLLRGADAGDAGSAGSMNVLRALEDDVAAYVCRNDLRERVRGFVQEAILRLMDSGNVDVLVVNAHSQGSVLCWDVLCRLPLFSWGAQSDRRDLMIRAFVTAGSPIRKYVDLFTWGGQVGQMAALSAPSFAWQNFWDRRDPVADPLDPPVSWRPGQPASAPGPGDAALLVAVDPVSGDGRHFAVEDHEVDNVENSAGGGLQAHDYWNNQTEFVQPLAQLLVDG